MERLALKNQKGTALFTAILMLILCSGLGLLAFRASTTELQISLYTSDELASTYLAESGVAKVLSWATNPVMSPHPVFFESLQSTRCSGDRASPDFQLAPFTLKNNATDPFSELNEIGGIIDLRLYQALHPDGICAVETKAKTKRGTIKQSKVELSRSPMIPITAGVQGYGETGNAVTTRVHWGEIRYTGKADLGRIVDPIPIRNKETFLVKNDHYTDSGNQDGWLVIRVEKQIESPASDKPAKKKNESEKGNDGRNQPYSTRENVYEKDRSVSLDALSPNQLDDLIDFCKKYGSYYVVSPTGTLEQNGVNKGSFDTVFTNPKTDYQIVCIDTVEGYSSTNPIALGRGRYKGYFYFTGNIRIEERQEQSGQTVQAHSPPNPSLPVPITLDDIHLDGLFYVLGTIDLQGPFTAYGALFARKGFTGPSADKLEVWYNTDFGLALYSGLTPLAPLKGTWRHLPSSDM